jgi:hypothetical protein
MAEGKIKVIKKGEQPDPKRSELSLLHILIERNLERAKEIIARLMEKGDKISV